MYKYSFLINCILKLLSLRFIGPVVYYAHTSAISISANAVPFFIPIRPLKWLNNKYKKDFIS